VDAFANALIDGMGGTTAVANHTRASTSTVHSWRKNGLTASRLDHLRRIAQNECPSVDVEAIAAMHGVELPPTGDNPATSSGSSSEISQRAAA